jgi:hypothetical protein
MANRPTKQSTHQLTKFESHIYKENQQGDMVLESRWKPVIDQVQGKQTIIGYFRSSSGYYEMRDREGKIVWSDEVGLEPSLISPVDIIGPALVVGLARSIGLSAGRLVFRSGISFATGRALAGRAGARLAAALTKMKEVAARLLSRKVVDMVSGPMGSVPRAALQAAMKSAGSTITVTTRLTARPQIGKALSVAVGDGASALAGAARVVGKTYTAKIPKALIVQLERIGLTTLKTTRMGNVVAKEYRFLEAASEFIVPLFR